MSDIASLQSDILAQILAAGDEAALEAIRVAALGKKGSISELLKTLGAHEPGRAQDPGPAAQRPARCGRRSDCRAQRRNWRMRRWRRG